MKLLIYRFKSIKKTREEFKKFNLKNSFIVFSFSENTVLFLSREYYSLLRYLRVLSKESNNKIIMPFYIISNDRKLVNALFLNKGKIEYVFGEGFSKKHLHFKLNHLNLIFLFYFELYFNGIKKRIDFSKIDLTIGIDNDEVGENLVFLDNKFFNKLVLVGFNGEVKAKNKENILKKHENLCEYNVQKF